MYETTLCETVMAYYTYACTYTKDLHNYTYPFIEDQRMNVERASVGSRRCDERERVNTCVNKLLFHAGDREFTSCPSSESPPTMKQQLNGLES